MDVSYINPFIKSTIDTYKMMLNVSAEPQKPFLKSLPWPTYDITGTIGLSGKAQGIIAMAYSNIAAIRTVTALVGETVHKDDDSVIDGIGEIVNIVAGYAKKDLTQFSLEISLPSVALGDNLVVAAPSSTPTIIIPFKTPYGPFSMELALLTPKTS